MAHADPPPDAIPEPGDPAGEAIPRLLDLYAPQLFALATRLCGSRDEGEDLVQEIFLRAFDGWGGFEGRASPKTWLYTIAANACQRMHRKRSGEPDHIGSLQELLPFGEPLIAVISSEQEPSDQIQIRAEALRRVEDEIASLPDEFRMPLILKEIVGFSVPEIAAILGLAEGTARSRVHRARLKLRSAVDRALPRSPDLAPPPAYPQQTCLDLLDAKQEALDRGVPFASDVICERCRSVFASMDLTHEVCRNLAGTDLPEGLRGRLREEIAARSGGKHDA